MTKKNKRTRERTDRVYGVVNVGADRTLTINYDRLTDEIEIVGAAEGSTKTECSYERISGKPKVVTSIPSASKAPFSAKRAIFAYRWVIAVDTNERLIDGKRCAVCVSSYVPGPVASYGKPGVPFNVLGAFLITGLSADAKPERIGWYLTLHHHVAAPKGLGERIALITDSELGLHRAINAREVGYYKTKLLPEAVTLVYASVDTDSDTLQGQMMKMCDRVSSQLLLELESKGIPDFPKNGDGSYEASAAIRTAASRS